MINIDSRWNESSGETPRLERTLTLPHALRSRSRQRVRLDDGEEIGLFLARGEILREGDRLDAGDGCAIRIVAADEDVMLVNAFDQTQLARIAYHLGNRHIAVEVGEGWLKLEPDHVLGAMIEGLGGIVTMARLPFEPESGAYAHSHADVSQTGAGPVLSQFLGHPHVPRAKPSPPPVGPTSVGRSSPSPTPSPSSNSSVGSTSVERFSRSPTTAPSPTSSVGPTSFGRPSSSTDATPPSHAWTSSHPKSQDSALPFSLTQMEQEDRQASTTQWRHAAKPR